MWRNASAVMLLPIARNLSRILPGVELRYDG
nr:MAG TPA: hypothetical protein [Caudoviricetes sp.]